LQEYESSVQAGGHQAHLVEAAETLAAWVHGRRAEWAGPSDAAVRPRRPRVVARPEPAAAVVAAARPPIAFDAPWASASADAPAHVPAPAQIPEPAWQPREPFSSEPPPDEAAPALLESPGPSATARAADAARSLGAPILRWSLRLGAIAAVVGIAAGAASLARPYWQKLTTKATTGTTVVESLPPGAEVWIDGVAAGPAPFSTELKAGHHVVEFRRRKEARTVEIDVTAGQPATARVDWNAALVGRLVVNSDPAGSHVLVDGRERGVTPLTLDDVPVGAHAIIIENDQGAVRRTVAITADRPVQLSESIYAGLLKVFAPFDLQITENGHPLRLDDQNELMMPSGRHELQIENRALGYRQVSRVDVEPGATASLSVVPPPSALSVTSTLPATVAVDGEAAGETPLADVPIKLGTHEIVVRSASGERRFTTTVTVMPVHIDVDFSKP
jgi:hypothetical protein